MNIFLDREVDMFLMDYDGVIIDSMSLKSIAYKFALSKFGIPDDVIENTQKRCAGLSRYTVLKNIYLSWFGSSIGEQDLAAASVAFDMKDRELEPNVGLYPDAQRFLREICISLPVVLITGMPQEAAMRSVNRLGIADLFSEVRGSPSSKSDHVFSLVGNGRVETSKCIFFGDGRIDQEAAEEFDIPFVGVDRGAGTFVKDRTFLTISNFNEIQITADDGNLRLYL